MNELATSANVKSSAPLAPMAIEAEAESGSRVLKAFGLLLWLTLTAATVYSLLHVDEYFELTGDPLAVLERSTGEVQYRPRDLVLWSGTRKNQKLFDGDYVSTEADGTAAISFGDGRVVELGENSIIIISSQRDGASGDFVVNILKGNVAARQDMEPSTGQAPSRPKTSLLVKAGERSFELQDEKSSIEVFKEAGKAEATLTGVTGKVVEIEAPQAAADAPSAKPITRQVTTAMVDAETASLKTASQSRAEEAETAPKDAYVLKAEANLSLFNADGVEPPREEQFPDIVATGDVVWTIDSLTSLSAPRLKLPLQIRNNSFRALSGKWAPVAMVFGPDEKVAYNLTGNGYAANQPIDIPTSVLASLGEMNRRTGFREWTVEVDAGLKYVRGQHGVEFYNQQPQRVVLRSLADVPNELLTVRLASLRASNVPSSGWFAQRGEVADASAAYAITLFDRSYLSKLAPYLNGSGRFSIARGTSQAPGRVAVFVTRGEVVSEVRATRLGSAEVKTLAKTFGSELVVAGGRADYVPLPANKAERFNAVRSTLLQRGIIKLVVNGEIIDVKKFILDEDLKFIRSLSEESSGILPANVEILYRE